MRRLNEKSQFTMLEAIIALSIVIIAVLFVRSFYGATSIKVASSTIELETLGNDVLAAIDKKSPLAEDAYRNSLLVKCIVTNNTTGLTSLINAMLPDTVLYNIYVYDPLKDQLMLWYPSEPLPTFGIVAKASRIIVYNGFVYEVELELWYV